MNTQKLASVLFTIGGIGMLVGGLEPLEGCLLILVGSGSMAIGAYLTDADRRQLHFRVGIFVAVTFGVAAILGMSALGGIGGQTGRSMWWGVLSLPYLLGWSLGIWGPGSPRWMLWAGMGVSLLYFIIFGKILQGITNHPDPWFKALPGAVLATVGVLTIAGCVYRLFFHRQAKLSL